MYVYAITNHQNTCIFFSIILHVLDIHHGRMRQDLLQRSSVFFYSKLSFNIVYFLHKTILKFKFTNTSNVHVNGLKQKDHLFFAGLNPFHVPFHATIKLFHSCFPHSTKTISQNFAKLTLIPRKTHATSSQNPRKKVTLLAKFHVRKREGYKRFADCTVYPACLLMEHFFSISEVKCTLD